MPDIFTIPDSIWAFTFPLSAITNVSLLLTLPSKLPSSLTIPSKTNVPLNEVFCPKNASMPPPVSFATFSSVPL